MKNLIIAVLFLLPLSCIGQDLNYKELGFKNVAGSYQKIFFYNSCYCQSEYIYGQSEIKDSSFISILAYDDANIKHSFVTLSNVSDKDEVSFYGRISKIDTVALYIDNLFYKGDKEHFALFENLQRIMICKDFFVLIYDNKDCIYKNILFRRNRN